MDQESRISKTPREMAEFAIGVLGDFLDPNRRSELMYQMLREVAPTASMHPEIQELLKRLDSNDGSVVLQTAKRILENAGLSGLPYHGVPG